MLRVFKFGGALMKDAAGIKKVVSLIEEFSCESLVVVVSAIGKTTNALEAMVVPESERDMANLQSQYYELKQKHLALALELFPEGNIQLMQDLEDLFASLWETVNQSYANPYQAYDTIVGFGEAFASLIIERVALDRLMRIKKVNATSIIVTNSNFTNANIHWEYTSEKLKEIIIPELANKYITLTQGFIGADIHGKPTTLGREGSDFTAAVLANLLHADEVTIWKDVPGVMNADPNRFSDCIKFDSLSYHEAIELAFYGATIIHPKTIQPLKQANIPLYVRSFYHPETPPTLISNQSLNEDIQHSIIVKDNQVLLSLGTKNLSFIGEENLTRLFSAFSSNKIHINLMQHSAVSFSVCFDYHADKLKNLLASLEDEFQIKYNAGLQLITLRHYSAELIEQVTESKKIFLEQRSRSTFQVLLK